MLSQIFLHWCQPRCKRAEHTTKHHYKLLRVSLEPLVDILPRESAKLLPILSSHDINEIEGTEPRFAKLIYLICAKILGT